MESWALFMDIFLNNPTPETEASMWLQQAFGATSSSSCSSPITACSLIALLTKPCNVTVNNSSSSPTTKTVMFIQTLPGFVQSRILSFLAFENKLFCGRDLCRLARDIMSGDVGSDFWVKSSARHLLDILSESNYEWISGLSLDSEEQKVDEEFESLPAWIEDLVTSDSDLLLPWLPISLVELNSRKLFGACENDDNQDLSSDLRELFVENEENEIEVDRPINVPLSSEIEKMARVLREQIMNFESSLKTISLANEMRQLCLDKGVNSFVVLGLIEPWKADDETASVLISNLSNGGEHELAWPSEVLCSVVLPKLLALEEPASRVLVSAMIEYCKIHQRAAVHALLFPLILRKEGINNAICDMITRIVRECLHPAQVSAFCQKLLSGAEDERKFVCLPCHQCLISNELRAVKTAGLIREAQLAAKSDTNTLGAALEVRQLPVLTEQDFGDLEGKKWTDMQSEVQNKPGSVAVETKDAMARRADAFLDEHLLPLLDITTEDSSFVIAIVSHGIFLSTLWKRFLRRLPRNSISLSLDLQSSVRPSLEHLGGWSNTGYLELHMTRDRAKVAPPVVDTEPFPTSKPDVQQPAKDKPDNTIGAVGFPQALAPEESVEVRALANKNLRVSEFVVSTPATAAPLTVMTPRTTEYRVAYDWTMTILTINGKDHLKGLKRTGGGVGSSRYDTSQKGIESFFKRRKID